MAGYLLHEQVFKGDLQAIQKLLEKEDPSEKDAHGNFNVDSGYTCVLFMQCSRLRGPVRGMKLWLE